MLESRNSLKIRFSLYKLAPNSRGKSRSLRDDVRLWLNESNVGGVLIQSQRENFDRVSAQALRSPNRLIVRVRENEN